MKKHFIPALCILLCAVQCETHGQAAGNFLYNNPNSFNNDRIAIAVNTPIGSNINLKAEVLMNVKATSYNAIFSAVQSGKDAYEVDSLMFGRIAQVRYALGLLGINDEDIHVDAVSMVPTYSYKIEDKKFNRRSIEIPTGFEMKKNIHVLFRKHDVLDRIISEMAFADIYDLVKVEYNIDGVQTYYDELRKAALSVIASKESTYDALKMHLDIYSMSDGFVCTYPMERYKTYTAYHSGTSPHEVRYAMSMRENNIYVNGKNNSINIDQKSNPDFVNQQFFVQTAEKNKTIFYDRIPYNQFDKVINADIEEPCIQLSYSLQVAYTMITKDAHDKNQEAINQQKEQMQKQRELAASGKRQKRLAIKQARLNN